MTNIWDMGKTSTEYWNVLAENKLYNLENTASFMPGGSKNISL